MPVDDSQLLLAYYGDDFTGSTDALEFLTRAGIRTALFIDLPTPELLARFPGLRAVGVAGLTRSLAPEAMEAQLRPAFRALRTLGAPHVHYKVCSTFDSSPTVGSIGRAIEVGAEVFATRTVPLLVGAPALGRYCVFGNLFARVGTGGTIHRLDRHPSMSRHPVTPADESDLRLHLARQTSKRIALLDILHVGLPFPEARAAFDALADDGAEVVLIDVLESGQLAGIGALIDARASAGGPVFSVGSSGVEMALGAHWASEGRVLARNEWEHPSPAEPLLVVSGSCSPVTAGQIDWALANGFSGVPLDPGGLRFESALREAGEALASGRHTLVYTSRGKSAPVAVPANELGSMLGRLARELLARTEVRRLVIAGGDTSSYAARALGVQAVEMIAPLAPGAPLCRAHGAGSPIDGREINLKGGQVGAADYFGAVARGTLESKLPSWI